MKSSRILATLLVLLAHPAFAAPTVYADEAAFLAAVEGLAHDTMVQEGFESDATWGDVRSTIAGGQFTAASVTSQGLTWRSNNSTSEVTTGNGPARTGLWGFYSLPHGSYTAPEPDTSCDVPGDCGDGLQISSGAGTMYAAGGWFSTNTPFAKVGAFVGGYTYFGNQCDLEGIDCEAVSIGTSSQFLGVVDPDGFAVVEFRELEGKTEGPFDGDIKLIFSDDFTIALTAAPQAVPVVSPLVALALAGAIGCIGTAHLRARASGRVGG